MADNKNNPGYGNSGHQNSGNWNSGHQNSGHRNSGDQNSGHQNSGHQNSGDQNSGDQNSGDQNSGHQNSGNWNSGHQNSGHRNSGDQNSGHQNSGHWNSGHWNSGHWNSTNRSSGIFCSNETTIRVFNKDSGKKWDEIDHPHFTEFNLTKWIPAKDMSDEEKKNNPDYSTTSGYLKVFTYKEAWANFWRDTDEENRQKILHLPNFDPKIFEEITGIDVAGQPDILEKDGKRYEVKIIRELKKSQSFN